MTPFVAIGRSVACCAGSGGAEGPGVCVAGLVEKPEKVDISGGVGDIESWEKVGGVRDLTSGE